MLAYGITFITFKLFKKKSYKTLCIATIGMLFMAMQTLTYLKESWWYDTMLCYGAGLAYSCYKQHIERFLKDNYFVVLFLLTIIFAFLCYLPYEYRGIKYNMFSITFSLLIVLTSMKIKVNNAVLVWMGKNLFPLYIYQRVPMLILSTVGGGILTNTYPVLYVICCFVTTVLIAFFYKHWSVKL